MERSEEIIRKKLLYRSKNRGCRETDILLGEFAEEKLHALAGPELALYGQFLDEYDGDIYKWLTGLAPMPGEYVNSVGGEILSYINTNAEKRAR